MKDFLRHLFLPHETNNHRAKLLHHKSLLIIVISIIFVQFALSFVQSKRSDVLGVTSDIAVSELLSLTNQKRADAGLSQLTLNDALSKAASQKASDMFSKNYWAHNAPDGTTPWVFIKSVDYDYLYAGENLARGFTTSQSVIDAWMASPGHRENMMSKNYQDIGFAIVPGSLTGDQTILVVEMFGSKRVNIAQPEVSTAKSESAPEVVESPAPKTEKVAQAEAKPSVSVASFKTTPLVDIKMVTKSMSTTLLFVFLAILVADLIIIKRRKIVRVVVHNIDTVMFLTILLLTVLIIGQGVIV